MWPTGFQAVQGPHGLPDQPVAHTPQRIRGVVPRPVVLVSIVAQPAGARVSGGVASSMGIRRCDQTSTAPLGAGARLVRGPKRARQSVPSRPNTHKPPSLPSGGSARSFDTCGMWSSRFEAIMELDQCLASCRLDCTSGILEHPAGGALPAWHEIARRAQPCESPRVPERQTDRRGARARPAVRRSRSALAIVGKRA